MIQKIKLIITIVISTLLISGTGFSETGIVVNDTNVLDIERAGQIALANNPSIGAVRERIIQAKEAVKQARSVFFPSLDAEGGVAKTDYSETSGLTDRDAYYSTELTATWVLFSGFSSKLSLLSAKDSELSEIEAGKNTRRLLLLSVAQSYSNVQLALETISTYKADILYYEKLLNNAELKKKAGSGTLSDVLSFQVELNSSKANLIDAEKEYKISLAGFAALLGYRNLQLPEGTVLTSLKDDNYNKLQLPVLDDLIVLALQNRPDLKNLEYTVELSDKNIGIARSDYYPTISLYGTVSGDRDDDISYNNDDFGNTAGVSVSINLFSGGLTRSKVTQAKAAKREAEFSLSEQKSTVKEEVVTAYYDLDNAAQQLELQKANAALVKRNRDLVESEYHAGKSSLVSLTEAQSNLIKTRSLYFQAVANLRFAQEKIKAYTGTNLKG